jgi:hydrocephalus-inducing protein
MRLLCAPHLHLESDLFAMLCNGHTNAGDIGTKFTWDTRALGKHFAISPSSGFLAPGRDAKLHVTLAPLAEAHDLHADCVSCKIDGIKEPLTLTLTGAAINDQNLAGTLTCACAVRAIMMQSITIANATVTEWHLKPVVQNTFWTGAEFFSVPAHSKAEYKVEYRPLTMACADAPHSGSVFFPIPDGSGMLYRLHGTADKPSPVDVIKRCAVPPSWCTLSCRVVLTIVAKIIVLIRSNVSATWCAGS